MRASNQRSRLTSQTASPIAATKPTIPSARNATDFPQSSHQLSWTGGLSSLTGTLYPGTPVFWHGDSFGPPASGAHKNDSTEAKPSGAEPAVPLRCPPGRLVSRHQL